MASNPGTNSHLHDTGEPIGSFYTWWRGDAQPRLPSDDAFAAGPARDSVVVATLGGLSSDEVHARIMAGHQPYVAWWESEAVACGWVATRDASIPALDASLVLPNKNRYLWDFATVATARGRGHYPRLIQAILCSDAATATRFWIGHDHGNIASARGILKAGFIHVGEIVPQSDGKLGLLPPPGVNPRAREAAALLAVALLPSGTQ